MDESRKAEFFSALDASKSGSRSKIDYAAKLAVRNFKYYKDICKLVEKFLKKNKKSGIRVGVCYILDAVLKLGDAKLSKEKNPYPKRIEKLFLMGDLFSLLTDCEPDHLIKVNRVLKMWVKRDNWFSNDLRSWLNNVLNNEVGTETEQKQPQVASSSTISNEESVLSFFQSMSNDELSLPNPSYEQYHEADVNAVGPVYGSSDPNDPTFGFDYGDEDEEEYEDLRISSNNTAVLSNRRKDSGQSNDFPGLVVSVSQNHEFKEYRRAYSTTISIDNYDLQLSASTLKPAIFQIVSEFELTEEDDGKKFIIKFKSRRDAEEGKQLEELDGMMVISQWEDPHIGSSFEQESGSLFILESDATNLLLEDVNTFHSSNNIPAHGLDSSKKRSMAFEKEFENNKRQHI